MAQQENDQAKVWDLAKDIGFCMLTTKSGNDLRARPMSAHAERDEHAFYFLTDVASHKDDEIARHPAVCLAFANPQGRKVRFDFGHRRNRERSREDQGAVCYPGEGLVGQSGRSFHPHIEGHAILR